MPGFADSLSEDEIVAVVCHERIDFGKETTPKECEEGATATDAGDSGSGGGGAGDSSSAAGK